MKSYHRQTCLLTELGTEKGTVANAWAAFVPQHRSGCFRGEFSHCVHTGLFLLYVRRRGDLEREPKCFPAKGDLALIMLDRREMEKQRFSFVTIAPSGVDSYSMRRFVPMLHSRSIQTDWMSRHLCRPRNDCILDSAILWSWGPNSTPMTLLNGNFEASSRVRPLPEPKSMKWNSSNGIPRLRIILRNTLMGDGWYRMPYSTFSLGMPKLSISTICVVSTPWTWSHSQPPILRGGFSSARRSVPTTPLRFKDHLIFVTKFGLMVRFAAFRKASQCWFHARTQAMHILCTVIAEFQIGSPGSRVNSSAGFSRDFHGSLCPSSLQQTVGIARWLH